MTEHEVFHYSIPEAETPSEGVIKTIASLEDCPPTALDALYTVIDPDALDQLFEKNSEARTEHAGRIVFGYLGYEVTVHNTDIIEVCSRTPSSTKQAG